MLGSKIMNGLRNLLSGGDDDWADRGPSRRLGTAEASQSAPDKLVTDMDSSTIGVATASTPQQPLASPAGSAGGRMLAGPGGRCDSHRSRISSTLDGSLAMPNPGEVWPTSSVNSGRPSRASAATSAAHTSVAGTVAGPGSASAQASSVTGPIGRGATRVNDAEQQAVLANVVMASTPTSAELIGLGGHLKMGQMCNQETHSPPLIVGRPSSINTPHVGEHSLGLPGVSGVDAEQDFHLQQCLVLALSQDEARARIAFTTMFKLLRNILANPAQPKYRSVRLSNPSIQSSVVAMQGAVEFLEALGFQEHWLPSISAVPPGTPPLGPLPASAHGPQQQQQQVLRAATGPGSEPQGEAGGGEGAEEGGVASSLATAAACGLSESGVHLHGAQALEGFLVLPEGAALGLVNTGLHELTQVMQGLNMDLPPAPAASSGPGAGSHAPGPSSSSPPTRPPGCSGSGTMGTGAVGSPSLGLAARGMGTIPQERAQPVDRQTQVVLPVTPDVEVPDWFFQLTGMELKATVQALARRRAKGEVLATRAWCQRQAGPAAHQPQQLVLRVRFAEGICLQGCFGGWELTTAVFKWVTEALRYGGITYELVMPSRKALPSTGLLWEHQDLWPSAVLNFRVLGAEQQRAFQGAPMLSDPMLTRTRAE